MFFEIIEPVSGQVGTWVGFHTFDRRLAYFDNKFLPDDTDRGILTLDDYKFAYHHKNASLVLAGGFDPYASKRITVYYDTFGSPSGQMRIEETSSAWLRPGKTELHDNKTRSLKELQPIQIAGLTLSLARVYAEEVVKK